MLARDGFLDLEEIIETPGFPGMDVLSQKKCVVVECSQNIPCNPCETSCPHNAITVGEPITNLPVVDKDKCIGCGLCVAKCPGLAIFLVDQSAADHDTVTMPYEYYPLPKKDQEVLCLGRAGQYLTNGTVLHVVMTKANDKTAVVEVKVPKGYGMAVRNFSTDGTRMVIKTDNQETAEELHEGATPSDMYVCRCEEITKSEVVDAIRKGATSVNEIKRLLRTGMGLCQGTNCGKTIERIIAQELNLPLAQVPQATKRGPVRPIKMNGYTSLDVEATADFFEHDW